MTTRKERWGAERMAKLLALRDGEIGPAEARHLQSDPETAGTLSELARIRRGLNALPDIQPGPAVWESVAARAAPPPGAPGSGRRGPWRWAPLPVAVAAGLLLALAVGLLTPDARQPEPAMDLAGSAPAPDPALEALYVRSGELEQLWSGGQRMPDGVERAYLYRIADLDSQLALGEPGDGMPDRQRMEQLWSRRVELLESLAEVRRTRAVSRRDVY